MKYIIGLVVGLNLLLQAYGEWIPTGEGQTAVNLLESDFSQVVIEIQLAGFESEDTVIEGQNYVKISVPGWPL